MITLLKRELLLARRNWIGLAIPLFFFVIVVSLFPFAVEPTPKNLQQLGGGVIWVAALLATLLSLEQFYRQDYEQGCLEQVMIMASPYQVACAKIMAHWLLTGLPLVLVSPLLAVMMHVDYGEFVASPTVALALSLLLGTPTLCLIGAIGMSLTLSSRKNGMLVAVLILPLYVPVLIVGSALVTASLENISYNTHLAILGAMFLLALVFAPIVSAKSLKISIS